MCLGYKYAQLTRLVFNKAVRAEVKEQSEGTATYDTQLLRTVVKVAYLMMQWHDI